MIESTKFFIDDQQTNYLLVEYEWSEDWSAGEGDAIVIDIHGIALNGIMSQKIASVKIGQPDWWAGIHEQIRKEVWEQVSQAA